MKLFIGLRMLFLHLRKKAFAGDIGSCQSGLGIDRPKTQPFVTSKNNPAVVMIHPVTNQKADDALVRRRVPFELFDKQCRARIPYVSRQGFEAHPGQRFYVVGLR